ncbi:hypothetical protein PR048_015058 [Dryococelus australis]|uniref:Uncharacterized protein n=1 Tax=Dryococelus australis TaxID=614101 RepID=A0ABQ9HFX9_9NEOP|nr:hypothetical protein PR048_015058 [Dryococelus australis]
MDNTHGKPGYLHTFPGSKSFERIGTTATPSGNATDVANFLLKRIICSHSVHLVIVTDRGKVFSSKEASTSTRDLNQHLEEDKSIQVMSPVERIATSGCT